MLFIDNKDSVFCQINYNTSLLRDTGQADTASMSIIVHHYYLTQYTWLRHQNELYYIIITGHRTRGYGISINYGTWLLHGMDINYYTSLLQDTGHVDSASI